jgi:predicted TIM-barrel fold metal-dependent hydrolase
MVANLKDFAEQEPYWGLLITPDPVNHTEQGWATPERMIHDMDEAGIDRAVILGEYRQKHESCVARNDQSLAIMRRWPDRVMAFAVVQPRAGPKTLDEIQRCLDGGMCGIGELNPYAVGLRLDDPSFLSIVEACIEHNIPLNLHVSEEIGHFYLGKSATPLLHYYRLACRFPELKLILAHWGGGLLFYEIMPEVKRNLANVWYDLAGSPLLYPTKAIFSMALQSVNRQKLLYGSDYPLLICPDKQREPDFRPFIAEIDDLNLSPEVYEDIMGNNAARLLGLMKPEDTSGERLHKRIEGTFPNIESPETKALPISRFMAVVMVANAWPQTQAVFEKFGIAWRDMPVPYWEPIAQAAAAHGYNSRAQQRLLDELNAAIT